MMGEMNNSTNSNDTREYSAVAQCGNWNDSNDYYADLTQLALVRRLLYVLYLVVMVVAIVGNQVIIWAILLHKHMRTATNWYILNLAVADFLIAAIVMPLKMMEDLVDCEVTRSIMTRSTCAIVSYLMPVIVFASIITLICISIERFVAVVFPLMSIKFNSACRAKCVLVICWLVPAVICTPFLAYDSQIFNMHSELGAISRVKCQPTKWTIFGDTASPLIEFTYTLFLFIAVYALPAVIIITTSVWISISLRRQSRILTSVDVDTVALRSRTSFIVGPHRKPNFNRHDDQKRRVARMVYFVALFFLFSWTPFYALNLLMLVLDVQHHLFTFLTAHLLGFINAAVSPIICFIMSERFRRCLFSNIHTCLFFCPRLQSSWFTATNGFKARSVSTSTYSSTSKATSSATLRRITAANMDIQRSPLSRVSDQLSVARWDAEPTTDLDSTNVTYTYIESERRSQETSTHI